MRGIPGGLRKGDLFVRYRRKGERRIFAGILRPDGEIASRDGRVDRPGEVFWLPPVTPGKIVAVGLNDREHALEMGKPLPREPLLFLKAVSSLGAHCGEVVYPAVSTRVDFEGEIALVVGRRADHIPPPRGRKTSFRDLRRQRHHRPGHPVVGYSVHPGEVLSRLLPRGSGRSCRGDAGGLLGGDAGERKGATKGSCLFPDLRLGGSLELHQPHDAARSRGYCPHRDLPGRGGGSSRRRRHRRGLRNGNPA